jgi:hypothetical protein
VPRRQTRPLPLHRVYSSAIEAAGARRGAALAITSSDVICAWLSWPRVDGCQRSVVLSEEQLDKNRRSTKD